MGVRRIGLRRNGAEETQGKAHQSAEIPLMILESGALGSPADGCPVPLGYQTIAFSETKGVGVVARIQRTILDR